MYEVAGERRYQRQRQIAMGYCLAVRHLSDCPFGINVNPLVVSRRLGKLIDTMLIDNDPVGQADLLADERFRIVYGCNDAQYRSQVLFLLVMER